MRRKEFIRFLCRDLDINEMEAKMLIAISEHTTYQVGEVWIVWNIYAKKSFDKTIKLIHKATAKATTVFDLLYKDS